MKSTPTSETRNYTLKDQIALIKCEVKDCLSREVRCNDMNCGGVGSMKSFSISRIISKVVKVMKKSLRLKELKSNVSLNILVKLSI